MWNKRDEVPTPKAVPNRPAPMESAKPEPQPITPPREPAIRPAEVQREPVRQPAAPSTSAAIGASMIIIGEIYSREELLVDGEVDGKLELQHRLTVGPNGKVRATIKAREVVVYGNVQGDVEVSDKITIKKNGSLVGDIRTAGIIIDDGAYFKGSIDIVKPDPKPAPPAARPQPQVAAQPASAPAAAAEVKR
jgi:cytoskeletal protein CcmA (bactofilin family)